jgi:hypothetical protein
MMKSLAARFMVAGHLIFIEFSVTIFSRKTKLFFSLDCSHTV